MTALRNMAPPDPRSIGTVVGSTAITKVLVMGFSGLLGMVTSRLMIDHFGVEAYAQYGLLATLTNLMPFADLGLAAVVLNTVGSSDDPRTDPHVHRVLTSVFRIMLISGTVVAVVAVTIGWLGWWPTLLGEGLMAGGGSAATLCLVIFGLALPFAVGPRILIGLGRNPLQVASQALISPFMFVSIGLIVMLGVPFGNYLAVFSYLGSVLVTLTCLTLGTRILDGQVGRAIRDVPRLRHVPGVRVMDVAAPMMIQMVAMAVAMQSDRILLSHIAGSAELAQYNLGFQLFGMVLQTITAAGLVLWPVFARARASSEVRSPFAIMWWFLCGGLVIGLLLAAVLPYVVAFVAQGRIEIGPVMVVAFVIFIGVEAMKYPLGMYMTDVRGMRAQVIPVLIMVPMNVGISWWLVAPFGAAGPVLGSAIAVLACQVLPYAHYIRRDLARRAIDLEGAYA